MNKTVESALKCNDCGCYGYHYCTGKKIENYDYDKLRSLNKAVDIELQSKP